MRLIDIVSTVFDLCAESLQRQAVDSQSFLSSNKKRIIFHWLFVVAKCEWNYYYSRIIQLTECDCGCAVCDCGCTECDYVIVLNVVVLYVIVSV